MKTDVYEQITATIVAELEKGVQPWFKPWNAEHAAGRITRPLWRPSRCSKASRRSLTTTLPERRFVRRRKAAWPSFGLAPAIIG